MNDKGSVLKKTLHLLCSFVVVNTASAFDTLTHFGCYEKITLANLLVTKIDLSKSVTNTI